MDAQAGKDEDAQAVADAVAELARRTRFPVAFGGLARGDAITVTSVQGARTHHLDGLVVEATRGLGGRAFVEKRPRLAVDYRTSRSITHDYDRPVLSEGISTLFAVPVIVAGRSRGVLYCGSWGQSTVGDVVARPAFAVAQELATELRVRDEVRRRLAAMPPAPASVAPLAPAVQEELRESFAELRSLAAAVTDASLRDRLAQLEQRLTSISRPADALAPDGAGVRLSPRETDVLACAALGSTNGEIAATLQLKEVTVKSYLQSAMAKLDASTRHAAVAKARRAGILP
ncbi:helix-turn-helix transcriptional regulator [Microbacterium thalassium]|uniref:DNA-binding CsgD family transcriptional regulator n=1 Tax=Microbacterium thalassium TaxID=362649 RepID=A0A7X0KVR5_9MICO|nr:LuxR C-terminal-related transcriptional regulator [Microbacterium thalassium]MBB6392521.1 DNA-binding CsgD family transcriptional regulator [Microbacterium thalassium]GLK23248.1 helix-turn-helix transcriptional regulator [Microbacterium thalassium]